ncbi:hypothetical protein CCR75_009179 [Bremia lactucae]|uniref:Uncharacterized protein n=1 Tax=Bremia lactucae TaxID=4779 RepID=A0A976FE36_BRELC|nr:hypothetical protein CCR75_009179 [Bremia lactucae]
MGWKTEESEEYESSAPAVQAQFHACRHEQAFRRDDHAEAEKEGLLASEKFLLASRGISNKRTMKALLLLADNYEYRAKMARARNSSPKGTEEIINETQDRQSEDKRERSSEQNKNLEVARLDPLDTEKAETQLNVAAAEMEELWRRLNEIGLSSPGSANKQLMMSSHLSSSLGDSFCLLPEKMSTHIGLGATAVDGELTLRAAVASRRRNQRQRLVEQQLGSRAPLNLSRPSGEHQLNANRSTQYQKKDGLTFGEGAGRLEGAQRKDDALFETVTHQKKEIVRLLNTVKTLSSENTKLVKKCEALTNIQAENREIRESMDVFKKDYRQKLIMIKKALEEWRRQRNIGLEVSRQPCAALEDHSVLEIKLKKQEETITRLMEEARLQDDRIAKYDKWYKTLKAGAKAKQVSQSRDGGNGNSSFSSSNSFILNGCGSANGSNNSFTRSSSFQHLGLGSEESTTAPYQFSRPPAHPNRRAL